MKDQEQPQLPFPLNGKGISGEIDELLLDPTGQANAEVMFPGYNGMPFRGKVVPDLKESDPEHVQPQMGQRVHVDILDLANEDHLAHYRKVMQLVGNGIASISHEEIKFDSKDFRFIVFLRWLEYYAYDPRRSAWGTSLTL